MAANARLTEDSRVIQSIAFLEREGNRVHAKPVTGRGLWGIVENVAQVRSARCTQNFGALPAQAIVHHVFHRVARARLKETWPSAVCIELGIGAKQLCVAAATGIDTGAVLMQKFTRAGTFRSSFSEHVEFLRAELSTPLLIGLLNWVSHFVLHPVTHTFNPGEALH